MEFNLTFWEWPLPMGLPIIKHELNINMKLIICISHGTGGGRFLYTPYQWEDLRPIKLDQHGSGKGNKLSSHFQ